MIVKLANSPGRLALVFLAVLAVASVLFSILEHVSLINGGYWAIITATTIGYGDYSPHSIPSKILTIALILGTVFFFIPMVTAGLASKLIVDRNAFTNDEQEDMKATLRRLDAYMNGRDDS